jgi:hypothetical protein
MTSMPYTRGGLDEASATRLGQPPGAALKEIPYDYVATFTLEGQIGNRLVDVVNVSVDGAFVAVAIGYSLLLAPPAPIQPPPPAQAPVGARGRGVNAVNEIVTRIPMARALPVNAGFGGVVGAFVAAGAGGVPVGIGDEEVRDVVRQSVLRLRGFDFLYSIVDSGSGRELQNQPIHNIAGLGSPDGQRPFRPFAKPMLFMPRSTIRIEIIEQSAGNLLAGGVLYFVLHGYKILGYGAPTA